MSETDIRITEKIEDIRNDLEELYSFFPENFEEYENSSLIRAATERLFEKIIEAVIKIVFLIISREKLRKPENEDSAFDVILKAGIIDERLAGKLKKAKGMRNKIIHQYEIIKDETVFTSISEEFQADIEEFIKQINEKLA